MNSKKPKKESKKKSSKSVKHSDRKHSGTGASSAARWTNCIGSVNRCAPIPEPPSSEFAVEGTHAHEVSEVELVGLYKKYPGIKEYGKVKKIEPLDPEMAKYVVDYCQFIYGLTEKVEVVDVFIEKRLVLDEELGMFGTGDFIAIVKGSKGYVGIVIDLKYGKGIGVEIEGNLQLPYYATALYKTFAKYNLVGAKCWIYQPRYNHEDGPSRGKAFSRKELEDYYTFFTDKAREAYAADASDESNFLAGDHCRWCKAKMVCPTYVTHMQGEAAIDFADYEVLPTKSEEVTTILSVKQIAHIVAHKKDIEAFLKAVLEYARHQAMSGKPLAGTKLVRGRANRKWIEDAYEVAKGLQDKGVQHPWRQSLRTITDIEEELGKGKLEGLTIKRDPPLNIVSESHKGEAVTPAALDFEDY